MNELLNMLDHTLTQTHTMAMEQSVTEAPIVIDGVTVIPVSKVSCGFSFGGTNTAGKHEKTTAGAGAKISKTPLRLIAVSDGKVQLLQVDEGEAKKKGILGAVKPLIEALKKTKSDKEAQEK